MNIPFYKYQGSGNDFILIDDRQGTLPMDKLDIALLTNRHFGIGSDGLILIREHADLDFDMIFYNPDGSQSFCGNGSRCAVQFAHDLGIIKDKTRFLSTDGIHEASILDNDWIRLQMNDAGLPVPIGNDLEINTGSPHYIHFRMLKDLDIISEAHAVRYSERYRETGINVNFVEILQDGIEMRTYERGVENETLSCGTGVTAAALATHFKNDGQSGQHSIHVKTKGGNLKVEFTFDGNVFREIYLCGPAERVFTGEIELN